MNCLPGDFDCDGVVDEPYTIRVTGGAAGQLFEPEREWPIEVRIEIAETQLSLAIGKRGQNVRLAARLTGWDIDILTPAEFAKSLEILEQTVRGFLADQVPIERVRELREGDCPNDRSIWSALAEHSGCRATCAVLEPWCAKARLLLNFPPVSFASAAS